MKAMILAAGKGTRLGNLTQDLPKALVRIHGIPVLELAILKLKTHGFAEIIVNIHHFGAQITEFLDSKNNFNIRMEISDEKDLLLKTGGGLKKASWFFDNTPFLLYNVDVITDLDLRKFYHFHIQNGGLATLAVRNRDTRRYLLTNADGVVCGWRNVHTGEERISRPGDLISEKVAFSGMSILSPEFLKYFPEKDIFSIMDMYLDLASEQHVVTFKHDDTRWVDIGKPGSIGEAEKLFPEIGVS